MDSGVALVALVEVDDHGRHPLESARARQRPGVEGTAGDDLRGELQGERLRLLVVATDKGVLVGTAVRELAGRQRVETRDDRNIDYLVYSLCQGTRLSRRSCKPSGELELAGDREDGRA